MKAIRAASAGLKMMFDSAHLPEASRPQVLLVFPDKCDTEFFEAYLQKTFHADVALVFGNAYDINVREGFEVGGLSFRIVTKPKVD